MKKSVLLSLLVGALASHNASAKIRTFDFTGIFGNLVSNDEYPAASAPGIVEGSIVRAGDIFTGEFSFDDAALDWTIRDSERNPALSMTVTFADGIAFSVPDPTWSTHHDGSGKPKVFLIGSSSGDNPFIFLNVETYTPSRWDLSNGTQSSVTFSWSRPGVSTISMGTEITSLTERGVSPIPEPSTCAMLLLGAAVVGGAVRRRAARSA